MNIKNLVKDSKKVYFSFYKDGDLWYRHEDDFKFPVPVSDVDTATMLSEDKAMLFMRYMRKHIAVINDAKAANA